MHDAQGVKLEKANTKNMESKVALPKKLTDAANPVLTDIEGVLLHKTAPSELAVDERVLKRLTTLKHQGLTIFAITNQPDGKPDRLSAYIPDLKELFDDVLTLDTDNPEKFRTFLENHKLIDRTCIYLNGCETNLAVWEVLKDCAFDLITHSGDFEDDRWIDQQLSKAATFWPNRREDPNYVSIEEQWLAAILLEIVARTACFSFARNGDFELYRDLYPEIPLHTPPQIKAARGAYIPPSGTYAERRLLYCLDIWGLVEKVPPGFFELKTDADDIVRQVMKMPRVPNDKFSYAVYAFIKWIDVTRGLNPSWKEEYIALQNRIAQFGMGAPKLPAVDDVRDAFERAQYVIQKDGNWSWSQKLVGCYFDEPGYWHPENTEKTSNHEMVPEAEDCFFWLAHT